MTAEIKGRMARGAVWMVALRLSVTLLGFASTVILARLLLPADFGLVALGTSMVAALDLLTSFRFEVALIADQKAGRPEYDTAWTLNQLLGLALALLLCLAAWPAALFYEEPRLAPIVLALAAGALLDGLQNIGVVNFRRDLNFSREFIFSVSKKLVQVVVAGSLAWWFRSYWALAAGILAASVTGVIASYAMDPYRPRWSLARARELFGFSKWLVVDNLMFFLRHRSSTVLIGKLIGPGPVGLFTLAYELAMLAHNNLTAPIDRAMFPGYSRMAEDRELLTRSSLSVAGMTALITVPVAVGIASTAPVLVPILFGTSWLGSIPLVQVLGFGSALSLLGAGATAVFLALGKPRLLVLVAINYTVFLLGTMLAFLPRAGLIAAAWAYVVAACVTLPVQLTILRLTLGLKPILWLRRVWRPALAATLMHLGLTWLQLEVPTPEASAAQLGWLLALVLVGAACYVAVVLLAWVLAGRPAGPEQFILDKARTFLDRPRVKAG
jgi:O-antigen/teichoic acid export membrane protein